MRASSNTCGIRFDDANHGFVIAKNETQWSFEAISFRFRIIIRLLRCARNDVPYFGVFK
jgi:hypothetical protein